MPVIYKSFQSVLANKEGKKLFYPRVVLTGNVDTEQVAKEIAELSSLSTGFILECHQQRGARDDSTPALFREPDAGRSGYFPPYDEVHHERCGRPSEGVGYPVHTTSAFSAHLQA